MKIQEECIECGSKRVRKLLEGRASPEIIQLIERSTRDFLTKGREKGECAIPHIEKRTELIKNLVHEDVSREKKDKSIRIALEIAPGLLETLPEQGFERFKRLAKIAIAGNGLELDVPGAEIDIEKLDLKSLIGRPLGIDDLERIYERLLNADKVLYCCDNAPELVFDKMLIEEIVRLGKDVTAIVRSAPVQDDATLREAEMIGLDKVCKVSPGMASTGIYLPKASKELIELFHSSDLIISKGMGNFEGLGESDLAIAYLLMAKCTPIGRELGVEKGCGVAFLAHS